MAADGEGKGRRPRIAVRPAVADDVPVIAKMMEEFYDYLCAIEGSQNEFDRKHGEERLARHGFGARPLFNALIAEADGEVAGYTIYVVSYWPEWLEGVVMMPDLFTREAWRGTGVGKALMARLAEIGREAGCEKIMWTVWERNAPARSFYDRMGASEMTHEYIMTLPIR